ncbi:MAG TPA: molybdopterin molybdotransferase MoeA, partial [Pseudomonadales bacterium]|nr:molybdopterin molybdotransferase MoeA [Pseudomonadales bacterium]
MAERSPLLPVDEAIERLLDKAVPVQETERVGLIDCVGRVLASDVISAIDVPPADNSQMDGYALNVDDDGIASGAALEVSDRIAAGYTGATLKRGTLARIFTGAPIPRRANAVVMQENTEVLANGRVVLAAVPAAGENIRPAGQDIRAGSCILLHGRRLRPEDTALAASIGCGSIDVFRRLRIAVMSTGDELVQPPGSLGPGQIFNSNHYALLGLVAGLGMEPVDLGLVADTAEATEAALAQGAATADCVVSSGGVSVGEEDHVKSALERLGHLEMWRLAIKPGKPLAFGDIGGVPF